VLLRNENGEVAEPLPRFFIFAPQFFFAVAQFLGLTESGQPNKLGGHKSRC
jgi:hypothetical protein